jgi:rRNA maturation endonuclease Nob1
MWVQGLARALGVPQEYLDAVTKGEEVSLIQGVKFCPQCWNPGAIADPMWSHVRAKFCYLCGTQLRTSCTNCGELVLSLRRHRFCPICGYPYKASVTIPKTDK